MVVGFRLVMGNGGCRHVLATVDIVLVVAGPEVLVENGAVAALEGVLLAVSVAEVVDLGKKRTSELTFLTFRIVIL